MSIIIENTLTLVVREIGGIIKNSIIYFILFVFCLSCSDQIKSNIPNTSNLFFNSSRSEKHLDLLEINLNKFLENRKKPKDIDCLLVSKSKINFEYNCQLTFKNRSIIVVCDKNNCRKA